MIHPQLVPHATMLVYILTDADRRARRPRHLPPPGHRSQLQPHLRRRRHFHQRHRSAARLRSQRRGVGAGNANSPRSPRSAPRSPARSLPTAKASPTSSNSASKARHRRRRPQDRQSHRPLAAGEDRVGRRDPNWGRLVAAIGYSGAPSTPTASTSASAICPSAATADAPRNSTRPRPCLHRAARVLHQHPAPPGPGSCVFWTTDLTVEYIHINADYST
jgi:glutamate N-acetyltransferase/amino-acid N-acetyltransferase